MLRSEKDLKGYRIDATDGELGKVDDFFVDDRRWNVQFMVVDTRIWLPGRKVLLAPTALGHPDGQLRRFPVDLTKHQIQESPEIDVALPVSLEQRKRSRTYGWLAMGQPAGMVAAPPVITDPEVITSAQEESEEGPKSHLRSLNALRGYNVKTHDDTIGSVTDFIIDDERWTVRYVAVDTGPLFLGKRVILSPGWIDHPDWAEHSIYFNLTSEQIENAPPYDPAAPINQEYEERIYDFYGRPHDWQ